MAEKLKQENVKANKLENGEVFITSGNQEFKHFTASGFGATPEQASINFIIDLNKKMPREKGLYDFFIRAPMAMKKEHDFATGLPRFLMRFRASFSLKAPYEETQEQVQIPTSQESPCGSTSEEQVIQNAGNSGQAPHPLSKDSQ